MKRIWKVLTGVVMGVLLVGAMWQPDITTAAPVGNAAVLHVDIAASRAPSSSSAVRGDCILGCYDHFGWGPYECEDYEHVAPQIGDYAEYGGGWHDDCWDGNCNCSEMGPEGYVEGKHGWCDGTFGCASPGGGGNFMAFTSGDPNAISLAFAQYGEALIAALVPVPERGAVQILGCDQEIVAHIPVSQATLDLLRSEYGV